MTLAAPKSRQGKFGLVLAIAAALVAVTVALLWASSAQAQLPTTVTELDQAPDGPAAVDLGSSVTYVGSATLSVALPVATDDLTLEIYPDDDLINEFVVCSAGTSTSGFALNVPLGADTAWCTWPAAVPSGTYTITLTGTAAGNISPPSAVVCADTNNDTYCLSDEVGSDIANLADLSPVDVGLLTVSTANLASVTPVAATNVPGTAHVVTFTLDAANVNCLSADGGLGNDDGTANDDAIACVAGDVTLTCDNGSATLGTVVPSGTVAGGGTVAVTINHDGTQDTTCSEISLALVANDDNDISPDDVGFQSPIATKDYLISAVGGELRHLDEPDPATEDQFGDFAAGGLLIEMDDPDDAIGSFHQACITGSALTHSGDAADITWSIVALIDGPPASSITEVAGPDDIPCVRWGSGFTGAQQITAVWDNGLASVVTFYWDGYCVEGDTCYDADDGSTDDVVPLELVKEWNDIDFTKIVSADGDVGDTLADNTGQLDLDANANRDTTLHTAANQDGVTIDVGGVLIIGPTGFGFVDAAGQSFVEYVFGDHSDAGGVYSGPIDGVEQTYTVTGDCGSVRLEDPVTGNVILLAPDGSLQGTTWTLLSSDKGVGFQIVPNSDGAIETTPANANCDPSSSLTVTIHSEEHELFRSAPLNVLSPDETITVHWDVGPPTNKQPLLLWAGMRTELAHDWTDQDGACPWDAGQGAGFYVRYTIQNGSGALVSDLGDGVASGPDFMVVNVNADGSSSANDDCISRVIFEAQDPGEKDQVAHVVTDEGNGEYSVISEQVPFLLYYMKFEDVTLGLVPGARDDHNSGDFTADPGPTYDPSNDVTDMTANVSADVLARVKVRGWLVRDNCPARDSGVDSNGSFLPANRCIFPDDWEHLAGGVLAEEFRPNYDIMTAPDSAFKCSGAAMTSCTSSADPGSPTGTETHTPVSGPFSLLDGHSPGDSTEPYVGGGFRETWLHDGDVDEYDAPMPPALVRFLLTGSGFLRAADKQDVYPSGNKPFYETSIPASQFITAINEDLSGYQWNTWGVGSKSGPYIFWTSLADSGTAIFSCPGAGSSPDCSGAVATGGFDMTKVYTDNNGEAMTWVNGDANLTWADCSLNGPVSAWKIVQLSGYYCENGDEVGNSTLGAVVDYPDKRKHQPIASGDVTITWTWGGIKEVTITAGATAQFNYVVFHVTDRDGFCDSTTSLHPVLGEQVDFVIDSPEGIIFPDANGDEAQGPVASVSADKKSAVTHTFDTGLAANAAITQATVVAGECQAWIHVSESQLKTVNVIITADDPEGLVTFDWLINPPATPTPEPTPAPENLWGDTDCDGDVDTVDVLGNLRHVVGFFVDQTGPCFAIGSDITVDGEDQTFGDWDCDGDTDAVDGLIVLLFIADLDGVSQTAPCPDIGQLVDIS